MTPSSNPFPWWREWWNGLSMVERIMVPVIFVITVVFFIVILVF